MALHGDIRVNDMKIGEWVAVRQEDPPGEVNTYKVSAAYQDVHGVERKAVGEIEHAFGDGALVLASEVLAWAGGMIYPGPSARVGRAARVESVTPAD